MRCIGSLLAYSLCVLALLMSGCASKWTISDQPLESMRLWPPPPNNPKLQHVATITGFAETGASLKTVVFGAEDVRFQRPVAVAVGAEGRIAVADTGCKCVHLFLASENRYQKLFALPEGEMASPVSVIFDDLSRLYVSDSALGRVLVFDKDGSFLFSVGKAYMVTLKRPTGLAYNRDKKVVYVADTMENKVYAFKGAEAVLSFGGRGTENGQLNFPTHLFWSDAGRLYVTDAMNFRVQIFDSSGNFVRSFGRHGDGSGDFAMPKGIAADKYGIIYVVDSLFDNMQLFNERGDFLLTVGSRGTGPDEFWLPSGIFIDANDKLYVCDTFNQRIHIFQITARNNEEQSGR